MGGKLLIGHILLKNKWKGDQDCTSSGWNVKDGRWIEGYLHTFTFFLFIAQAAVPNYCYYKILLHNIEYFSTV